MIWRSQVSLIIMPYGRMPLVVLPNIKKKGIMDVEVGL